MITDSILNHCLHPIKVPDLQSGTYNYVGCGKCSFCRCHTINVLAQKLDRELLYSKYCYVFTLTYDNKHVKSITLNSDDSFTLTNIDRFYDKKSILETLQSVNFSKTDFFKVAHAQKNKNTVFVNLYSDYQLFIKRLRKYISKTFKTEIRYFLTLEYGTTTFRPHAHLIIFSKVPLHFQFKNRKKSSLNPICITFQDLWKCGFVTYDGIPRKSSSLSSYISNYVNSINLIPSFLTNKYIKPRSRHSSFLGISPQISIQDIANYTDSFVTRTPTLTPNYKTLRFDLCTSTEFSYFFPRLLFFKQHSFSTLTHIASFFIDKQNNFKFNSIYDYTKFILTSPYRDELLYYLHINDSSSLSVHLDFNLLENLYTDFPVSPQLNIFNLLTHADINFIVNTYCCASYIIEETIKALSRLQYIYYYFRSIARRHLNSSFHIYDYFNLLITVHDKLSSHLLKTSLYALQNSHSDMISLYYSLISSNNSIDKDLLGSLEYFQNLNIDKHIKHKKQSSIL